MWECFLKSHSRTLIFLRHRNRVGAAETCLKSCRSQNRRNNARNRLLYRAWFWRHIKTRWSFFPPSSCAQFDQFKHFCLSCQKKWQKYLSCRDIKVWRWGCAGLELECFLPPFQSMMIVIINEFMIIVVILFPFSIWHVRSSGTWLDSTMDMSWAWTMKRWRAYRPPQKPACRPGDTHLTSWRSMPCWHRTCCNLMLPVGVSALPWGPAAMRASGGWSTRPLFAFWG